MSLTRKLHSILAQHNRIILYSPISTLHLPIVLFNIKGLFANQVSQLLDSAYNIIVRSGLHCAPLMHKTLGTIPTGAVRISLGYSHTEKDIMSLTKAILNIADATVDNELKQFYCEE